MLALADDRAAGEVALLPVPDHLRATDATERPQRGHEINRFEDVRLALRVVAEQQVEARRKIHVQPRVIAEVSQSQMGQMHGAMMRCSAECGEIFRGGWRFFPIVFYRRRRDIIVSRHGQQK